MGRSAKGSKPAKARKQATAPQQRGTAPAGAGAPADRPDAASAASAAPGVPGVPAARLDAATAARARHRLAWVLMATLVLAIGTGVWWLMRAAAPAPAGHAAAASDAAGGATASANGTRAVASGAGRVDYVDNALCVACHRDAADA